MIELLQEMTTRRLKNLRNKAVESLLLGAQNDEAIKSIDTELERRGIKESHCDNCYWDISDTECHGQGKHKITDGTCPTYRKNDNRGGWIRDESGKILIH